MTALQEHLQTGATHVCHCWAVVRSDGLTLGFTDHDRELNFEGIRFVPQSGMSARAVASSTGLSVTNSEAIGVLQSDAVTEADIIAGRYDAAEVTMWRVRWDDPDMRQVCFFGTFGEITRASGAFQAELRGLTDALNQPQGKSYLRSCSAVLGDARCRVDVTDPAYTVTLQVEELRDGQVFRFGSFGPFAENWFENGTVEVLTGVAQGLTGLIKRDVGATDRTVTLWQPIRAQIAVGDVVRLVAGCDKRSDTCRDKFTNLLNFRGFPDIPGEDWLVSVPRAGGSNTGASRSRYS